MATTKTPKTKAKKPKSGAITTRGKRKEAIARATITKGKGLVTINKFSLDALTDRHVQAMISEPLNLASDIASGVDLRVSVFGGGPSAQAQACRTAIARAIIKYSNDDPALKTKLVEHDRTILVEDSRRVEPKKYKGPKARARFQKSYR